MSFEVMKFEVNYEDYLDCENIEQLYKRMEYELMAAATTYQGNEVIDKLSEAFIKVVELKGWGVRKK